MNKVIKVFFISVTVSMMLIGCSSYDSKKKINDLSTNIQSVEILGKTNIQWDEKLENIKFDEKYPEYFCKYSKDEIFEGITIANYDINKITPLDGMQELIEFGNLYGELDSDKYLQILILDEENFYSVNVSYKDGEISNEEGEFFLECDKEEYINDKIEMIKEIIE